MTRLPSIAACAFTFVTAATAIARSDDGYADSPELGWLCPVERPHARDVGIIDDPDSVLRGSELWVSGAIGRAAIDGAHDQRVKPATIGARYAGDHLTLHLDGTGELVEAVGAGGVIDENDRRFAGNLRAGAGYRALATKMGGIYRRGLGVRATVGIDISNRGFATPHALSDRWPWARTRYAPGQYFELMAEARYELAGCHKPFVHLTGGMIASKDLADRAGIGSITIGTLNHGALGARGKVVFGLTLGYDLTIAHVPVLRPGTTSVVDSDFDAIHRVRVGVWLPRLGDHRPNLGLIYATHFGTSAGYEWTLRWTWPLNWGYGK